MSASDTHHSFWRNASHGTSLTRQIEDAEREILGRNALVSARASLLGDTARNALRQHLTSPGTLLWAAGFGFFAGELSRPKPIRRRKHADHDDDEEDAPGVFSTLLQYVAIARSLAPMLSAVWNELVPRTPHPQDEPQTDEPQSEPTLSAQVATAPPAPTSVPMQSH
ncbi:MAG TPA: hypothetical protein VLC92_16270 [Rhodocyclaceae bacterium]|nr:hypothetical protein [Rhodocyclaceae bacterium]